MNMFKSMSKSTYINIFLISLIVIALYFSFSENFVDPTCGANEKLVPKGTGTAKKCCGEGYTAATKTGTCCKTALNADGKCCTGTTCIL